MIKKNWKKRGIFIFVVLMILNSLVIVNGAGDIGCCLEAKEGGDRYCVVKERSELSECKTNMWDNGELAVIRDDEGRRICNALASVGGIVNGCEVGCSITNGVGDPGKERIESIRDGADKFEVGVCDNRYVDEIGCILEDEFRCHWGWTIERCVDIEGGTVYRDGNNNLFDEDDCTDYTIDQRENNMGCCEKIRNCFYTSGVFCFGDDVFYFYDDLESCVDIEVCRNFGCSFFAEECDGYGGGRIVQRSSCGGERLVEQCDRDLEYCDETTKSCLPMSCDLDGDGNADKPPDATWCEAPLDYPGSVHVKWECNNGKAIPTRCGYSRERICVDDGEARCVDNNWKDCFDLDPCVENCVIDGENARCCEEVSGKCMPKYSQGFRFWLCNEYNKEDCLKANFWRGGVGDFTSDMCRDDKNKDGCERSGDCVWDGIFDAFFMFADRYAATGYGDFDITEFSGDTPEEGGTGEGSTEEGIREFIIPNLDNVLVDVCYDENNDVDGVVEPNCERSQDVADEFCKIKGFDIAVSYTKPEGLTMRGRTIYLPTMVICEFCRAHFNSITCRKE